MDETKKCPMCAEEIGLRDEVCEYCGTRFDIASKGYCPGCKDVSELDSNNRCLKCGTTVADSFAESTVIEQAKDSPGAGVPTPPPALAGVPQTGGEVGVGGGQPSTAEPPGGIAVPAAGAVVPPYAAAEPKKKHRVLWVLPLVLLLMVVMLFAGLLLAYPYTRALRVYIKGQYNSMPSGTDVSGTVRNDNTFDWPKTFVIIDVSGKGTYYCPVEGSGAYETQIPKGSSVVYRFGKLKNTQTGQEEDALLTSDQFLNAKFTVKVDFESSDSFWVKLRKKLGMKTQSSISNYPLK